MTENHLFNVAIRFVKYTDAAHDYAVFELGRVSDIELKELEKAYSRPLIPIYGDPTNGIIQKSEAYAHLYTVRLCLFVKAICEGKDLIEKVYGNSNVTITYTPTNARPTLKSIEHSPCRSATSWFERHPVDWEQHAKEEEREMNTPNGYNFKQVALNVKKYIGGGWYVVRIGRLDGGERAALERLSKNLKFESFLPFGDPTEGRVIFSSERKGGFSEATVCVRACAALNLTAGATYDCCCFRLESGEERLELEAFDDHSSLAAVVAYRNWFEKHTFFEASGVVVCNRGSSSLQITRLDGNERCRFDAFFGEYGSELDGQFDKLLTDKSWWYERDRVLTNVSFAEGLEFKPGESICLDYIKIEKADDGFKVVAAERATSENVEERWHLASAKRSDESLKRKFVNVAVRIVKRVSHAEYYILEIGRLTDETLDALKEVFRYTTHINDGFVNDETNGEVVSKEMLVPKLHGERLHGYYTARICVFWPGCPLAKGATNDAAAITLESHDGNYRPTVTNIYTMVYTCPTRRSGKTAELKRQLNAIYGRHSMQEGYIDTDIAGEAMRYCMHDVAISESCWRVQQKKSEEEETMKFGVPKIKQIIFNDPATVVLWEDGTKTVVHARDEEFDPEKGVAMAVARKALGNDREYYTYLQRHIKKGLRDASGCKKESKPTGKKPAKKKGGKK